MANKEKIETIYVVDDDEVGLSKEDVIQIRNLIEDAEMWTNFDVKHEMGIHANVHLDRVYEEEGVIIVEGSSKVGRQDLGSGGVEYNGDFSYHLKKNTKGVWELAEENKKGK